MDTGDASQGRKRIGRKCDAGTQDAMPPKNGRVQLCLYPPVTSLIPGLSF